MRCCLIRLNKQLITQSFGVLGCDKNKPTIIFLGGKDECNPYDVERVKFLRLRYNIIAVTFLGYPGSGGVTEELMPVMFSSVAEAAKQVIDAALELLQGVYGYSVLVERQVFLCGYSVGAGVALKVASCWEKSGKSQFRSVRCIAPFTTVTFKRAKRVLYRVWKGLNTKIISCIISLFCGFPSAIGVFLYPVFKFFLACDELSSTIFSAISGVVICFLVLSVVVALLWRKAKINGVSDEDRKCLVKQKVSFELVDTDEVCNYNEIVDQWLTKKCYRSESL